VNSEIPYVEPIYSDTAVNVYGNTSKRKDLLLCQEKIHGVLLKLGAIKFND